MAELDLDRRLEEGVLNPCRLLPAVQRPWSPMNELVNGSVEDSFQLGIF
ncbi:MAG: hypothetical protein RLZZ459_1206 [Cyanobacteriota bacterium]